MLWNYIIFSYFFGATVGNTVCGGGLQCDRVPKNWYPPIGIFVRAKIFKSVVLNIYNNKLICLIQTNKYYKFIYKIEMDPINIMKLVFKSGNIFKCSKIILFLKASYAVSYYSKRVKSS